MEPCRLLSGMVCGKFWLDLYCRVFDASLHDVYVDSNLFVLGRPSFRSLCVYSSSLWSYADCCLVWCVGSL